MKLNEIENFGACPLRIAHIRPSSPSSYPCLYFCRCEFVVCINLYINGLFTLPRRKFCFTVQCFSLQLRQGFEHSVQCMVYYVIIIHSNHQTYFCPKKLPYKQRSQGGLPCGVGTGSHILSCALDGAENKYWLLSEIRQVQCGLKSAIRGILYASTVEQELGSSLDWNVIIRIFVTF